MPRKFLIIQTAFIGDVVLATALVESIHTAFPEAAIDFMVRKGNEMLLDRHPLLRRVLIWDKKTQKLRNLFKLLIIIRRAKYDTLINVQRYAATGFLTAFSGAGETIGFTGNPLSFLFSRNIPHQYNGMHEIVRNHRLIEHLVAGRPKKPVLYPGPDHEKVVLPYTTKPFITISPASVWFTKQYPPQKWAAFINAVPDNLQVYLLGGNGDRPLADAIIQMTEKKSPVNLCGELNFLQSAALMKYAGMNYVNDSAPLHFASAMNAPVTVIYCSTVPAFGYGPLSDVHFIVEKNETLYCRPCGLHGFRKCPQGHFRCALDIKEEQFIPTLLFNSDPTYRDGQ